LVLEGNKYLSRMTQQFEYSEQPAHPRHYTERYNRFYTHIAPAYGWLVKTFPLWRNWISAVLPHIRGPKVLEVSFGTGSLLSQYADQFSTFGIDYNPRMVHLAQDNLRQDDQHAYLQVADAAALPYESGAFDTLVNTMAFSGYPDSDSAFSELARVLRPGGRIVMVDVNYPRDGNWRGKFLTNAWKAAGDLIRDMGALFEKFSFEFTDEEIGGFGSVHLYVGEKLEE
jgi:ubiquinone/menaquinone biosynthesis C-methylase UbiE